MKVYEIKFTESGSADDEFLDRVAHETGYNSTRHLLYAMSKWDWEVSTLKEILTQPKYLKWLTISNESYRKYPRNLQG